MSIKEAVAFQERAFNENGEVAIEWRDCYRSDHEEIQRHGKRFNSAYSRWESRALYPVREVTDDDVNLAFATYVKESATQGGICGIRAALESFRSRLIGVSE